MEPSMMIEKNISQTRTLFSSNYGVIPEDVKGLAVKISLKQKDEYSVLEGVAEKLVKPELPDYLKKRFGEEQRLKIEFSNSAGAGASSGRLVSSKVLSPLAIEDGKRVIRNASDVKEKKETTFATTVPLQRYDVNTIQNLAGTLSEDDIGKGSSNSNANANPNANPNPNPNTNPNPNSSSALASFVPPNIMVKRMGPKTPKPVWHAPWKLMRVISGHLGWVRSVAVEPGNEWFATGSADRLIKIWDLGSGTLKLSLTGHISAVRGLAISDRHPYLFSCGEDKMVKCWDLEQNKVIRHYHGHLSGIYAMALHPTLDLLVTAGRDSVARVWDMRTKQSVHVLSGHTNTIAGVLALSADPQIITSSMDSTVRTWDLVAGRTLATLTHHKKSVRALAQDPREFAFYSGSSDSIRRWQLPDCSLLSRYKSSSSNNSNTMGSVINTLAINEDRVLFSGGDNGSMSFWDARSGYNFQTAQTTVQPGSLDSEAGIFCSTFDRTGLRLITGEADKSIKIWREDENATPATHPIVT